MGKKTPCGFVIQKGSTGMGFYKKHHKFQRVHSKRIQEIFYFFLSALLPDILIPQIPSERQSHTTALYAYFSGWDTRGISCV